jgi:hypothetical protein
MSALAELQARQIVRRMRQLRNDVDIFARHAKTLSQSAGSIDGRALLQEADNLLRGLQGAREDFQYASANVGSVSRSLSSRPPVTGGPPPAAQWGAEFRAGSKQFVAAVLNAEKALGELYGKANAQMNSPTRVSTSPDNLIEVLMTFIDALSRWIEYRRNQKD